MRYLLAIFLSFIILSAHSQQSPQTQKIKTEKKSDSSDKDKNSTKPSPEGAVPASSTSTDNQDFQSNRGHSFDEGTEFWPTIYGFRLKITDSLLVIFTFVLSIFTALLWRSTEKMWKETKATSATAEKTANAAEKSATTAERALIAGERAFVFAKDVNGFWEIDKATGQYHWRFRPVWENSGDTPTKHMTMHTQCILRDTALPLGFNFDENTTITAKALIPPKSSALGGIGPMPPDPPISPQDIIDIQSGRKLLYLWGCARYWDVFPSTKQHITRFCWSITPTGDPFGYIAGKSPPEPGGLSFPSVHHNEGNCADDECA